MVVTKFVKQMVVQIKHLFSYYIHRMTNINQILKELKTSKKKYS